METEAEIHIQAPGQATRVQSKRGEGLILAVGVQEHDQETETTDPNLREFMGSRLTAEILHGTKPGPLHVGKSFVVCLWDAGSGTRT